MSGKLDDTDIDMFLNIPMSSERDIPDIITGTNSDSDITEDGEDFIEADSLFDTDDEDAVAENEATLDEAMEVGLAEYDVSITGNSTTVSENGFSLNEDVIDHENMNDDVIEDAVDDVIEDAVDDGTVSLTNLAEQFRKLTKKTDKAKMRAEEENKWDVFSGKQKNIIFNGGSQFNFNLPRGAQPIDYFSKYLTDDILETMVIETNRNASQVLKSTKLSRSSRLKKWQNTNIDEMKKFLGLVLYMGLVGMPEISDYWSTKMVYRNLVAGRIMGRNRFQLLLRFWHFNNNENADKEGRLAKLSPLLSHLNQCFKRRKTPGQDLVVDESMVPFRGRLYFRQYLPQKTHKYGIKLFKICDTTGYTLQIKVYMGKGTCTEDGATMASSVVMELMNDYLDQGHVLYADNFYTSVDLANALLARDTHLVGTVKGNRSWFPHKKTIPPMLNIGKGEMSCLEYPSGIVYTRWVDKREVKLMSTVHPVDYVDTGKKTRQGNPILKPLVVAEYNKAKMGIDLSDQMSAYNTPVRKSMRWYHKIAEEILLGTAVVNAWLAYKSDVEAAGQRSRKNIYSIKTFREKLVYSLVGLEDDIVPPVRTTGHHYLSESNTFVGEGKNKRRTRKNCKLCYKKSMRDGGRLVAKNLKKVTTFCEFCPGKPYLCKDCFKNVHK